MLILIVVMAAFQLGYLSFGPRLNPAREVSSPYAILPSKATPISQFGLIPHFNANTAGTTSFGVRFRLNVTSFISGGFSSTQGAEIFIFPSDSGGAFWASLSKGASSAQDFTFSTGISKSGAFNLSLAAATWELLVIDPSNQNTIVIIDQPIQAVALCSSGPVCHPELVNQ